jgi:hypothetical protein
MKTTPSVSCGLFSPLATGEEIASQQARDAEAAIGDLPAGLTMGVSVTARNAAGESQPTDNVQIVVP